MTYYVITIRWKKADEFQRPPQKALQTKDPFIWDQFRMVKNEVK